MLPAPTRELRRYIRRDGSLRERGPYWYFQFHEGGDTQSPEVRTLSKRRVAEEGDGWRLPIPSWEELADVNGPAWKDSTATG